MSVAVVLCSAAGTHLNLIAPCIVLHMAESAASTLADTRLLLLVSFFSLENVSVAVALWLAVGTLSSWPTDRLEQLKRFRTVTPLQAHLALASTSMVAAFLSVSHLAHNVVVGT